MDLGCVATRRLASPALALHRVGTLVLCFLVGLVFCLAVLFASEAALDTSETLLLRLFPGELRPVPT